MARYLTKQGEHGTIHLHAVKHRDRQDDIDVTPAGHAFDDSVFDCGLTFEDRAHLVDALADAVAEHGINCPCGPCVTYQRLHVAAAPGVCAEPGCEETGHLKSDGEHAYCPEHR